MKKKTFIFSFFFFLALLLAFGILVTGNIQASLPEILKGLFSPDGSTLSQVLWELRLPRILSALLAGAAMGCAGLLIQTYFENPLADPYVLGVHSGSSLFVTLFIVLSGGMGAGVFSSLGLASVSALGALGTLFLLLSLFRFFPSKFMILVLGLIFGYFLGGIVSIIWSFSDAQELKTYFLWNLGSFSRSSGVELKIFSLLTALGLGLSFLMAKPLNLLLLGEQYARSLGLQTKSVQLRIIFLSALLSGTVTAFCGPIAFIGIMAPHASRLLLRKADHRQLIPLTCLCGIVLALGAELCSGFFSEVVLPINAVLSLLGFPWILFLLFSLKKGGRYE